MNTKRIYGAVAVLGYIATIYGANWLIETQGFVSVGFGLSAPAGVFMAGLAFTFRDVVQDLLGKAAVLVAILVGALFSMTISARFGLASGIAFGLAELLDFSVYTPLRAKGWLRAAVASNIVGFVADSVVFLTLAFGSLEFLPGQVVGKLWTMVPAFIGVGLWKARGALLPRYA